MVDPVGRGLCFRDDSILPEKVISHVFALHRNPGHRSWIVKDPCGRFVLSADWLLTRWVPSGEASRGNALVFRGLEAACFRWRLPATAKGLNPGVLDVSENRRK
ncbi:MAG TPA: hypothetical protein DCE43_05875 [Planctomycetaceae bacterium]|nr:hypothetical protein [Planctomycetaceae bacterium]HCK53388.1 hypothetical protein [Planctomycetaceae bacterium]